MVDIEELEEEAIGRIYALERRVCRLEQKTALLLQIVADAKTIDPELLLVLLDMEAEWAAIRARDELEATCFRADADRIRAYMKKADKPIMLQHLCELEKRLGFDQEDD